MGPTELCSMTLVNYLIVRDDALPPIQPGVVYEYVLAANGVFVRGRRDGLEATIPIAHFRDENNVRGLAAVEPSVCLLYPRVPARLLDAMLIRARQSRDDEHNLIEILFYLTFDADAARWHMVAPPQEQGYARVIPLDRHSVDAAHALVHAHSHHNLEPAFSRADDVEDTGFRISAVLGHLSTRPTLRVRVGIYGYRMDVSAWTIFEESPEVQDATTDD